MSPTRSCATCSTRRTRYLKELHARLVASVSEVEDTRRQAVDAMLAAEAGEAEEMRRQADYHKWLSEPGSDAWLEDGARDDH
jgi:hypothetical protein